MAQAWRVGARGPPKRVSGPLEARERGRGPVRLRRERRGGRGHGGVRLGRHRGPTVYPVNAGLVGADFRFVAGCFLAVFFFFFFGAGVVAALVVAKQPTS